MKTKKKSPARFNPTRYNCKLVIAACNHFLERRGLSFRDCPVMEIERQPIGQPTILKPATR